MKSVELVLVRDKVKLVCRVRSHGAASTTISWLRDGSPLHNLPGAVRIRQRR